MANDMTKELSSAAKLRDALEEEIVTGQMLPGSRLDEVSLAERFGVSRTPVREALHQLASAGLVEIQPRRGATVTELHADTLVEMFDVMAELEAMAVGLAARRHTEADKKAIVSAHAECKCAAKSGDVDRYYYANEAFHDALYAASHHAFLITQCRQLHRRLKAYRRLQLRVRHRVSASLAEHQSIIDAILAFDQAQAAACARRHIVVQGERFGDLIASLKSLAAAE